MDATEVSKIIENAVEQLYLDDGVLIDDKVHEQSISARVMCYLQEALPQWHVDVEFNRQGEKRDPKTDAEGLNRRPDIIIHRRGPDGPNLAVILVKCAWNTASRDVDAYVAKSIKTRHDYQVAYLLEIGSDEFRLTEV